MASGLRVYTAGAAISAGARARRRVSHRPSRAWPRPSSGRGQESKPRDNGRIDKRPPGSPVFWLSSRNTRAMRRLRRSRLQSCKRSPPVSCLRSKTGCSRTWTAVHLGIASRSALSDAAQVLSTLLMRHLGPWLGSSHVERLQGRHRVMVLVLLGPLVWSKPLCCLACPRC